MPINKLIKLVEPELLKVNEIILEAAQSEIELIPKLAKHLIEAGGKRLRPVFTLACAKMCGYEGDRHVNLAVCVEFMHTATLLHDDVVDDSQLRRGRKTANNIWGNKASVLVGDYLLGKAFQRMTADGSLAVLQILSDAAARIAEGEVMQLGTANNIETTHDMYIQVVQAKTAELFAAACEVGGAIVEDAEKRAALRAFGDNFGIAFQIVDDALDYMADEKILGKNIGDDLREGKMTLPIIMAYEGCEGDDKKLLDKLVTSPEFATPEELERALKMINDAEYPQKSLLIAHNYAEKAKNALEYFPNSTCKSIMLEVLEYSITRQV